MSEAGTCTSCDCDGYVEADAGFCRCGHAARAHGVEVLLGPGGSIARHSAAAERTASVVFWCALVNGALLVLAGVGIVFSSSLALGLLVAATGILGAAMVMGLTQLAMNIVESLASIQARLARRGLSG